MRLLINQSVVYVRDFWAENSRYCLQLLLALAKPDAVDKCRQSPGLLLATLVVACKWTNISSFRNVLIKFKLCQFVRKLYIFMLS